MSSIAFWPWFGDAREARVILLKDQIRMLTVVWTGKLKIECFGLRTRILLESELDLIYSERLEQK